eukprot:TRINITY_DN3294_c3_g5_i2.p1 TRINITY_DN3294_c3_g5~~TRINITY_DN3294_c3_g5_i2.p1  ORF type:complete len:260 (+),score=83.28 TRINITY_DN3294_c3_g5_i2:422-1201(+)
MEGSLQKFLKNFFKNCEQAKEVIEKIEEHEEANFFKKYWCSQSDCEELAKCHRKFDSLVVDLNVLCTSHNFLVIRELPDRISRIFKTQTNVLDNLKQMLKEMNRLEAKLDNLTCIVEKNKEDSMKRDDERKEEIKNLTDMCKEMHSELTKDKNSSHNTNLAEINKKIYINKITKREFDFPVVDCNEIDRSSDPYKYMGNNVKIFPKRNIDNENDAVWQFFSGLTFDYQKINRVFGITELEDGSLNYVVESFDETLDKKN